MPTSRGRVRRLDPIDGFGTAIGLLVVAAILAATAGLFGPISANVRGGVVVAVVLLVLTVPIAGYLARVDGDRRTSRIILLAVVAKLIGAGVRYAVVYGTYDGLSDARRYYFAGVDLSTQFQAGLYPFGELSGTRFMEIVTGFAYTILPRSELAGFFFFSWLAFLGLVLFTRAVRRALPSAEHRWYELLVLFLPTLLFWPSSIGKDAWMVAALGLAAYGVSLILTHQLVGLVPFALGAWGAMVMRPHVALILLAAVAPAWLVRPTGGNRLGLSPVTRALGLVALIVILVLVIGQAERFFGVQRLDADGVVEVADSTESRTNIGGSDFEVQAVKSPVDLPAAAVTVVLRPFIWEASNAQQVATGLESLFLIGLIIHGRRQLWRLPRTAFKHAYVMFALVYTLTFIVAYSTIGNFGILVRQRAQLYPLFLVLLLPLAGELASRRPRERGVRREPSPVPA